VGVQFAAFVGRSAWFGSVREKGEPARWLGLWGLTPESDAGEANRTNPTVCVANVRLAVSTAVRAAPRIEPSSD
jgi:hypothetical protein